MQDRKLASIQRIENITPIPNADRIELARVLGWDVVVLKDKYKAGDLCIYIQIDSVLPDRPEFEFMRPRKFRVRTIKLRKQVSQGLVVPISLMENLTHRTLYEGMDVTAELKIKKYEPWKKTVHRYQKKRKDMTLLEKIKDYIFNIKHQHLRKKYNFPTHLVPQTVETRIQNSPSILREHAGDLVNITEKLDGTSATYLFIKNKFTVCSRAKIRKKTKSLEFPYWEMARDYDIKNKIKIIGTQFALQGEIIGPNVQNGTEINYQYSFRKLFLFNIYDMKARKYVNSYKFDRLCHKMKIAKVPTLGVYQLPDNIESILEMSHGDSKLNKKYLREGIVVRSRQFHGNIWDFSFKCVDPKFELKYTKKRDKK